MGERGVEDHIGISAGLEFHQRSEHIDFLEVQVGNASSISTLIGGEVLT